jgi:DNA-binding transcriptional MerR regulator
MQEYLSVGDAAKRLGVVPATVKLMVRSGRLQPVAKTVGGITLFDPLDVDRLVATRKETESAHKKGEVR